MYWITPGFTNRLNVKLSQFKTCWGIARARYVKTAQKASLFCGYVIILQFFRFSTKLNKTFNVL
jgi:hypothetical protein